MMIDDAFNLPVDPVRMEMTGTEHITISNVCSLDDRKSKGKITDKKLSQVYYTEESESE